MTIDGETRFIALVIRPQVGTSQPMNAAFAASRTNIILSPMDIQPEALANLFSVLRGTVNCVGLSVTVPHKQSAARLCDELEPRAKAVPAVNVIRAQRRPPRRRHDGRLRLHRSASGGRSRARREARSYGRRTGTPGPQSATRWPSRALGRLLCSNSVRRTDRNQST